MRLFLSTGAVALALSGPLAAPLLAQQQQPDWNAVQIRTVSLGPGLYVLFGQGGNIGLSVGDDGAFVIDNQFAPLSEKILAAIRAVTPKPVRFVVNTHWHGDHTGGNENFGKAGALIVAHDNVRRRMNPAQFKDVVGRTQQAPPVALPVVTFGSDVTFHWNGETIVVRHVPNSHTDGDAVIQFVGADVIHLGDTFFNGRYPFIDLQSGGSLEGMIASSNRVLGMMGPQTRLIPAWRGRGRPRADRLSRHAGPGPRPDRADGGPRDDGGRGGGGQADGRTGSGLGVGVGAVRPERGPEPEAPLTEHWSA